MYSPLTRFTVQRLRQADVPIQKVCEMTGLSERSVRRIQNEDLIEDPAETDEWALDLDFVLFSEAAAVIEAPDGVLLLLLS